MSDPAPLSALLHCFAALPTTAGDILFINGIFGPGVPLQTGSWHVVQPLKYEADRWPAQSVTFIPEIPAAGCYERVLVLVPKQHQAARYDLALATRCLGPGGILLAAGANDAGGRRIENDLAALGLPTSSYSRSKSRVVQVNQSESVSRDVQSTWLAQGDYQPVVQRRFTSRPGLFSWDRIDEGSALLAVHIPVDLAGCGADFGCGYGFLATHVLQACPAVTSLICLDADARAVEACRRNTAAAAGRVTCGWHDLTVVPKVGPTLDFIVMNPPFHEGNITRNQLGRAFIQSAAACLRPGGLLLMVANTHLPYEDVLKELFASVKILAVEQGYKVIEARR